MPEPPQFPGVYVEDVPSGVHTIASVGTSRTAFVGRAWRGPVDQPVRLLGVGDFERRFGGAWSQAPMALAVQQFFLNGGSDAWVVRVATREGAGRAQPACLDLGDGLVLEAVDPGTWGRNLAASLTPNHDDPADPTRFDLALREDAALRHDADGRGGSGQGEVFVALSLDPRSPRFVGEVLRQSALVRVRQVGSARPAPRGWVQADPASGHDGLPVGAAEITDAANEAAGTGLFALDADHPFHLLCLPPFAPGLRDNGVDAWRVAAAHCRARGAVLLVDAPAGASVDEAIAHVRAMGDFEDASTAMYFPRLRLPAGTGVVDVAPCGAVAGMISRVDRQRGVWKAPAGTDAILHGVSGLSMGGAGEGPDDADVAQLNEAGICTLRKVDGVGVVAWGARFLAAGRDPGTTWKYLPVRRTALMIEASLRAGTAWAVFQPHGEPLWAQLRLSAGGFLQTLFRQGAFAGTTPRDAWFVRCGADTHTAADIAAGRVRLVVGFAPLKPAEFVVIELGLQALPPVQAGAPATPASDPYRAYRFVLAEGREALAGFARASSLAPLPPAWRAPPLVLEQGLTRHADFDAWLQSGAAGAAPRDLVLEVRGLGGERALAYRIQGCRLLDCQSLPEPDTGAVAIQQLRLAFDTLTAEP